MTSNQKIRVFEVLFISTPLVSSLLSVLLVLLFIDLSHFSANAFITSIINVFVFFPVLIVYFIEKEVIQFKSKSLKLLVVGLPIIGVNLFQLYMLGGLHSIFCRLIVGSNILWALITFVFIVFLPQNKN